MNTLYFIAIDSAPLDDDDFLKWTDSAALDDDHDNLSNLSSSETRNMARTFKKVARSFKEELKVKDRKLKEKDRKLVRAKMFCISIYTLKRIQVHKTGITLCDIFAEVYGLRLRRDSC